MSNLFLYVMKVKYFILFLTILAPVLIYVFLESFGSNKYEIPVYYSEGVTSEYCEIRTSEPYTLKVTQTTLFYAHSSKNNFIGTILKEMVRIESKTKVRIVGLEDLNEAKISHTSGVEYKGMLPTELVDYLSCKLLVYNESQNIYNYLVLVDNDGGIRGYYNSGDFADYDRLFAELDILDLPGK